MTLKVNSFYKNIKKILIPFYIAILFIILLDPQKRIWWGYNIDYKPYECNDLVYCFRVLGLGLVNLGGFFVDQFQQFFRVKFVNNIYFIPHYSIAVIALTFIFHTLSTLVKSFFLYLFLCSYIFLSIKIFVIPLIRVYDYLAIVFIFFVIKYFDELKKNFFSIKSIFMMVIGSTIFYYLGFMYFCLIILYNFFENKFKNLNFQLKHLILILVPLATIYLIYLFVSSYTNFAWNNNEKVIFNIEEVEKYFLHLYYTWGIKNTWNEIIISITKYSFLLIFCIIYYFYLIKFKFKTLSNLLKKKFNFLLLLLISFFFVIIVGSAISGFWGEWQRQFLPLLFISTILSGLIIDKKRF